MHPIFDYKKYSLLEYQNLFSAYVQSGGTTELPFDYKFLRTDKIVYVLQVLDGEANLFLYPSGEFHFCNSGIHSLNTSTSFTKDWSTESYSAEHVHYLRRKSKGITYKKFTLSGAEIEYVDGNASLNSYNRFRYMLKKHAKHYEHNLRVLMKNEDGFSGTFWCTDGLYIKEMVRKKTQIVVSSQLNIRLTSSRFQYYRITIKAHSSHRKGEYVIDMDNGSGNRYQYEVKNFPDASIVNLFNKELMWEFDLMAEPDVFNIVQTIREHAPMYLRTVLDDRGTCSNNEVINRVLQNMENVNKD